MTDAELIEAFAIEVMDGQHYKSTHPYYPWYWRFPGYDEDFEDFNPIHNLNHAFMGVERMRGLGFIGEIDFDTFGKYGSEFFKVEEDIYKKMFHDKLGRAICEAAVMAVRGIK